jgi:arylformamidase
MKYFDISVPLSPHTPNWPGGVEYKREEIKTSAIVSTLTIRSHYATHVDAPRHFLFNDQSVDKIPVTALIGEYKVFALKSKTAIELKDVQGLDIKKGDRVLFKTINSNVVSGAKFDPYYVSLSAEAAKFLATKKIALVGIDYFGIEQKGDPEHMVHKVLLKNNIVIVEGLNLQKIKPGIYQGAILPLKIQGGDGAPARAVLWK